MSLRPYRQRRGTISIMKRVLYERNKQESRVPNSPANPLPTAFCGLKIPLSAFQPPKSTPLNVENMM